MFDVDKFHDECGIVGVFGHPEAANLAYLALYALQHRGQESAGIVSADGGVLYVHKALGLVADVFSDTTIMGRLTGTAAIGHNRYSTTGRTMLKNTQPFVVDYQGGGLAVGHNGNLVNAVELRHALEGRGSIFQSTADTEVIVHLIAMSKQRQTIDRVIEALSQIRGAYCLVFLTPTEMIVARDPNGFRPLVLGHLKDAVVVASETCAFDLMQAIYTREVLPGEVLHITASGTESVFPFPVVPSTRCFFEYIYFSRPDSQVYGQSVYLVRKELGRRLAINHPVEADIVIAVPDSGMPAALGYAEQARLPFEMGLIRNHYVGRTFIEPSAHIRHFGVKVKLNPQRAVLCGKDVVVVDDSIVRGTTSRKLVQELRSAGARKVHLRISSPPIIESCFFGVDTPTRQELLAFGNLPEAMRDFIGVDTLGFLTEIDLDEVNQQFGGGGMCKACFTGHLPMEVPVHLRR